MPLVGMVSFAGKAKASRPGQAGTPTITSQSSGQVGISWTAPSFSGGAPITDYKIEYSSNSGSTWTEWSHTPSTATSATVTGLPDYLTYIFRVSAKNAVGFGTASSNSAGASQFNAASGGTEQTISNYNGTGQTWKVHTYTSVGSGSFVTTRAFLPFRGLTVGGGGSGGGGGDYYRGGGRGGRGQAIDNASLSLSTGTITISVGSTSGTSSIGAFQASGGGGTGANGNDCERCTGSPDYGNISSNISGSSITYAGSVGSPDGDACQWGGNGGLYGGPGGGGGGNSNELCGAKGGGSGAQGIVIIAYRIA